MPFKPFVFVWTENVFENETSLKHWDHDSQVTFLIEIS